MRPFTSTDRSLLFLLCVSILVFGWASTPLDAQAPAPAPATRKPAPQTRPRAPQPPAAPKPAAKPAEPAPPAAPPPPEDVRFKTSYTTGDQKTETTTFVKGPRERFEFQDMVLLKQHDQKRIVQISRAANTYLVAPEGMPSTPTAPAPAVDPALPPKPPGIVMVATTIVDTGERKMAFGQQARHVKSIIDKQPTPGACDTAKHRVETDGWYIDVPKALEAVAPPSAPGAAASGCGDQIQATSNGDPKALGFPISYTTTIIGADGKPSVATMEMSEFELTTLDQALFEIPQGLNAALNIGELGKALSNANEAKLAAENAKPPAAPVARVPGVIRIGVPELSNKTTETVDTRALRAQIVSDLTDAKFEVTPLAAATQAELQTRATERDLDYIVMAEVTELKVSKGGGLGGIVKAASKIGGSTGGPEKPPTEATVAVKLIQPDGKQRLSTTTKGKDGGGFSKQTGFGLARLAGSMAVGMMMGPQMMSRMYSFGLAGTNMGGMGLLGSPDLYQMQTMGMMGTSMGRGAGIDATAGAASYMVQQAMAMNSAGSASLPGAPSFNEALGEALDNASKAVTKVLVEKK